MITTQQAVMSLRPGVEWSMNGDDVEGITWHTPNTQPLTVDEVEAEMIRLETEENNKINEHAAAQAAAIAHAKNLGFTDEMISTMWPNLEGAL